MAARGSMKLFRARALRHEALAYHDQLFRGRVGERTPLSVISYDLLDNGVMNKMRIDFGESSSCRAVLPASSR